jgi:hypothetical protein
MTELALREDDAPFSWLGFPYSRIEAAIGALKQVGRCLGRISGKDAVSLRAVVARLRERILEANNLRHRFRGRTGRFARIPHLLSPQAAALRNCLPNWKASQAENFRTWT